ncbi:MAG: SecDF P1 head subdomain-containing protein [Nocardioidaceae bacterium]
MFAGPPHPRVGALLVGLAALAAVAGCGTAEQISEGAPEPTQSPPAHSGSPEPTAFRVVAQTLPPEEAGAVSPPDQSDSLPEPDIPDPLQWTPSQPWRDALQDYTCPEGEHNAVPRKSPILSCDDSGKRYLLGPAVLYGGVEQATAEQATGREDWVVDITLTSGAGEKLESVTTVIAAQGIQLAVVTAGEVIIAPAVEGPIRGGRLLITGSYTREEAQTLADRMQP